MKAYTIAVPRYLVESESGTHIDVFNKKVNAIESAMKLATEYRGTTFNVFKKTFYKKKIVFTIQLDMTVEFEDAAQTYKSLARIFQEKADKSKYWRKTDESGK